MAGEKEKPRRISSAIIPYDDIAKSGFRGHVYYEDGADDIVIDAASILRDNEEQLNLQMLAIEKTMDEEERQFRCKHMTPPFTRYFNDGFPYLIQRLHCQLDDVCRVVQAETHAQLIQERIDALQADISKRGFGSEIMDEYVGRILMGLRLLHEIMARNSSTKSVQREFDLIYDGIEKAIDTLQSFVGEIDHKLQTAIP